MTFSNYRLRLLSRRILIGMLIFCFAVVLVLEAAHSQAPNAASRLPTISDGGGVIPVQVIDGRVVVACDISGPNLRIPVNLWLDFDGAYGLQLHNRAAAPLPAETQAGKPNPLTLHFPAFSLEVARRELGPEDKFEEFTKYHSKEIGEDALVGAIGAHILKHFDVVFDLPNGEIELLPTGQLADQQPTQGQPTDEGDVVVPITLQNDLAWLPIQLQGSKSKLKRAFAIGSSQYDSRLDRRLCNSLRRPAGNVGPVTCVSIDFAPYVAFRPSEIVQVHPDGVAGMLGINLLEKFRIHVDRQSGFAAIRSASSPAFPREDLEYFQAMVAEDRDLVSKWLDEHGQTRLGREAAELLLTLMLDDGAEQDELKTAIEWINTTMPEDLRATRLMALMEELVNEGETELGIMAGQIGVKSARKDRYPEASYKLHGRLGELMLPVDKREAWRHLLSAAFGLPDDGMINLNLGRVYEANNKKKRAFSRYLQALIKEESSEMAMAALMRMDAESPANERLTIEAIDRMISGRVRNYSAPERYVVDPQTRTNRTCLVEFFTNAYVGTEQRGGAIGGAMGNQGVISHFAKSESVFLSYHLSVPRVEPLVTPLGQYMASWLGVGGPVSQVVDGRINTAGAGKHREAEEIYKSTRDVVVSRLQRATPITISGRTKIDGGLLSGQITIQGPPIDSDADLDLKPLLVQVVVAERGVVFHGSSGVVIHRMLARGLATDGPLGGIAFLPDDDGKLVLSIDRDLADIESENTAFLNSLEEGQAKGNTRMGLRIEPSSVEVIVVVRDAKSGEVAQAYQCDMQREEVVQ